MEEKKAAEEKTREEVEAERKAKRAAKQERKKVALEKQKIDRPDNQQKPKDQSLETTKKHGTNEPVKEPKPVSKINDT